MIVYRLSKRMYAEDLSGKGAELYGGRWNSKGNAMVYTGQSIALCVTEIAVHTPLGKIPEDYVLVHLEVPDDSIHEVKKLPSDWRSFPHSNSTQEIGDRFLKAGKFLMLKVPSAAVQGEFNAVINPRHQDIKKVKILKVEKVTFDDRIFVK